MEMEKRTIEVTFIKSTKQNNLDKVKPSEIELDEKNFINDVKFSKNYENWLEKDIFPSDETLANLASLTYDDHPRESIDKVCPGWRVLTTARNAKDGYFGTAYWSWRTQQLVVGHRGTRLSQNKALLADIEGIIFNRHTSQINSACSFVAFLLAQFTGQKIQVSFTGHSLGAWLAQITTFSAEYLLIDEPTNTFRVKAEDEDEHHAHTVTFDSPGCRRMLSRLSDSYFHRYLHYDHEKWAVLDITNYLTSPNLVNICNNHVGNLLQLSIKTPNTLNSCWLLYTLHYHSRKRIVEALGAKSTEALGAKSTEALGAKSMESIGEKLTEVLRENGAKSIETLEAIGAQTMENLGANRAKSTEPLGAKSTEPLGAKSTEPLGAKSTEPLGAKSTEPLGAKSTEPLGAKSTEPLGAKSTEALGTNRAKSEEPLGTNRAKSEEPLGTNRAKSEEPLGTNRAKSAEPLGTKSTEALGASGANTVETEGTVKVIYSWPLLEVPEEMIKDDEPHPPSNIISSYFRTLRNIPSLIRAFILIETFEYKTYFKKSSKNKSSSNGNSSVVVGDDTLHFQLADFNGKCCSTNVFSEREKVFLCSWLALEKQGVSSDKQKEILAKLKDKKMLSRDELIVGKCEMNDGDKIIRCDCESELRIVINGVKQLFRLLPQPETTGMNRKLAEESKTDVRICETMSKNNVDHLTKSLFVFQDSIGLQKFFSNSQGKKILLLETKIKSDLEITRIFSLLKSREKTLFLNLIDLQHLSKFLDLSKTFARFSDYLIVLDAQSSEFENIQIFLANLLESILKENLKSTKLIFVINGELNAELINDAKILKIESHLNFSSFTADSQNLLREKLICFSGRNIQLSKLIDIEGINNLNLETIETLTNNQVIKIGGKSSKICELKHFRFECNETILKNNLMNLLKLFSSDKILITISTEKTGNVENFLKMINCDDEGEKSLVESATKSGKLVLNFDQCDNNYSEIFTNLCEENLNSKVYWLQINISQQIILREVFSGDLFFEQNFSKSSEIPNNVIRHRLVEENPSAIFIFCAENVTDLIPHFRLKSESLKRFNENVKKKNILVSEEKACLKKVKSKNKPKFEGKSKNKPKFEGKSKLKGKPKSDMKAIYKVMNQLPMASSSDDLVLTVEHDIDLEGEKLVLLSDEPGMGKSIKLVEISEKLAKIGWVLHVNLLANQTQILSLKEVTINSIIDFLAGILDSDYPELVKELLSYQLKNSVENSEPIFALFDGFDEIKEETQSKIIEILKFLKDETLARIWVTTRTDHKRTLENELFAFSASLEKFSPDRKKEYMIKFWKILLNFEKFDENRLEKYANEVLEEARSMLGGESSRFLGNPLHIRMLAEVTLKLVRESVFYGSEKLNIRQHHNLQSLFHGFISVRFDDYFAQSLSSDSKFANQVRIDSFKSFRKSHGLLALQLLFPAQSPTFFQHRLLPLKHDNLNLDEKLAALSHVGLIKFINGKYQFIYQILADYFLADLLLNWLYKYNPQHPRHSAVQHFLMNVIFFEEGCSFIRRFLNKGLRN